MRFIQSKSVPLQVPKPSVSNVTLPKLGGSVFDDEDDDFFSDSNLKLSPPKNLNLSPPRRP